MNEFKLIEYIGRKFAPKKAAKDIILGIGDDCSIIRTPKGFEQVTTVDSLVEGNHFSLKYFTPREIGRKALRVNLSDLASMGASSPYYAWLVFAIPKNVKDSTIKAIIDGVADDCRRYSVTVAGGNLTSSDQFSIHVTLTGWVKGGKYLSRSSAKVGDLIYVTGNVGMSSVAYRQFKAGRKPDAFCLKRWANPQPKLDIGKFLLDKRIATSCIDISDGIFQDLRHLTSSSSAGAILEWNRIPIAPKLKRTEPSPHTIGFGEDYELLFTVPPAKEKLLMPIKKEITRIGEIVRSGFKLLDKDGKKMDLTNIGYSHFT